MANDQRLPTTLDGSYTEVSLLLLIPIDFWIPKAFIYDTTYNWHKTH